MKHYETQQEKSHLFRSVRLVTHARVSENDEPKEVRKSHLVLQPIHRMIEHHSMRSSWKMATIFLKCQNLYFKTAVGKSPL